MTTAPYIDDLLPIYNLAALLDLASHLNGLAGRWPVRRQQHVQASEAVTAPAPPGQRSWHRDTNPSFRHPAWGRGGSREREA